MMTEHQKEILCSTVSNNNFFTFTEVSVRSFITRATRSIARYILRLGGWMSHASILSKRLSIS